MTRPLLIVGASARAAAFSALRAGFQPCCLDLFADVDLAQVCPVLQVRSGYPEALESLCLQQPPAPWIYTGGLETRPGLVDRIAQQRPLWGNDGAVLRRVRDPFAVYQVLTDAGIPVPHVCQQPPVASHSTWLAKPRNHVGGRGIRFMDKHQPLSEKNDHYFQEWIEGKPAAAIFVAGKEETRLAGVTAQLVGEPWVRAKPFCYCGSIGPLPLSTTLTLAIENLGQTLARAFSLRGIFGVDGILQAETFWPVEINPRYTASVEVIERATGWLSLAEHARAFSHTTSWLSVTPQEKIFVGKSILFASRSVVMPTLANDLDEGYPTYADIPAPRTRIEPGQPILSLFCQGDSEKVCLDKLRTQAQNLEQMLVGEEL